MKDKVILLGSARTGSNLLLSLLNSHSEINILGELFNLDAYSESDQRLILSDPIEYIDDKLNNRSSGIVGFKLFYDHMRPEYFKKNIDDALISENLARRFRQLNSLRMEFQNSITSVFDRFWDFIYQSKEFKIIHLVRLNKLDTLISLKRALITNEWVSYERPQVTDSIRLSISPEECLRFFQYQEQQESYYDKLFDHHQLIKVTYENLVSERGITIDKIFQFLEVQGEEVSTYMSKQNIDHPSDFLINYKFLQDQFKDTKYEVFFDDEQLHV